ncbi:MAG: transglycosylase SLT domain-containing protein [Nitrospirae bacterium]|nr:transglycosylase SLT domain-containing protein [Nitrospirota bacterium]
MKSFSAQTLLVVLTSLFTLSGCQTLRSSPPLSLQKPERSTPPVLIREEPVQQCLSAEACFNLAKDEEKNGRREAAITTLLNLIDRYPDAPWLQRSEYLLAKWKIESKAPLDASFLSKIQQNYPEMGDYVSKLVADHAFNQNDFSKASDEYGHLLVIYSDTVLRPQILIQRGEALFRLKEYEKAAQTFTAFYRENPKDEKVPEGLSRLVDLYSEQQEWDKTAKVYRDLQWKYPDTSWSVESEKKLSVLTLKPSEREQFKLTPQEEFYKGKNLYETGRFEKAIEVWKGLKKRANSSEPFLTEMELKTGLAYLPLKKYTEASGHFYTVLKKAPNSEFSPEALLGLVRIALREENETDLKKFQEKGEQLFSHQEVYYKVLYLLAAYYEDRRQFSKADVLYQTIIKELPQSSIAPDALWREGWVAYKEGDPLSAESNFSRLLEQYPASALQAQALYWKGRAEERRGAGDAAQVDFKKLCQTFGHSYYCHLARKRITSTGEETGSAPANEVSPGPLPVEAQPGLPSYRKDDHYMKAEELMSMNLTQEASKEFNFLAERYKDKNSLLQIDLELNQSGDFYHALKNLRSQFPDILDRGKTYDSPLLWQLAYPKEVLDLIMKITQDTRIEPEFIAGIMREESVFDLRATSRSGAMGLMQLMPFTGEWVAQQLGVASFVRERLYDQELNIQFGAYYLDHLNQKFQGNLVYTAASYNAGPEAVSKWIVNGNVEDIEEFVENIPYQETRYYVKRVMKSYEEFKQIKSMPGSLILSHP